MHTYRKLGVVLLAAFTFSGCSVFDDTHQWDYLESESTPALVIPAGEGDAGLHGPKKIRAYDVPENSVGDGVSDVKELEKMELPPAFDNAQAEKELPQTKPSAPVKGALSVRGARNTEGYDLLVVEAKFDDVWDKVGESLKSIGFVVEDGNRGEGIYAVYQVIHKKLTEEEEFLRPRFDKGMREEYRVHVEDRQEQTRITIRNTAGKIDDSALAKHLLTQLKSLLSKQDSGTK